MKFGVTKFLRLKIITLIPNYHTTQISRTNTAFFGT
jgi:hypothetical protein